MKCKFIQEHLNDDVRRLALGKAPAGVDLRWAIQQIDGRQRAKTKLPTLCANPDIIFPVHLSVEQCSSENTAQYKSEVVTRFFAADLLVSATLTDLTGGFGIDFMALAPLFSKAIYVEKDEALCQTARHNFAILPPLKEKLSAKAVEITNSTAEDFLTHLSAPICSLRLRRRSNYQLKTQNQKLKTINPHLSIVFIDPARRSDSGSRSFAISDCTPDVIRLLPMLKGYHATHLLLKLSPMLDWHKAIEDIQKGGVNVPEVHIVSVNNECKELLLLIELQKTPTLGTRLFCKNDESLVEVPEITNGQADYGGAEEGSFLLIPNASIMKAGCFNFLSARYGITQAAPNSHIFFSETDISDFPGKRYRVERTFTLNNKEVREALQGISHANISVRNFPLSADSLRKRLKLKDGGQHHIFATNTQNKNRLYLTVSI